MGNLWIHLKEKVEENEHQKGLKVLMDKKIGSWNIRGFTAKGRLEILRRLVVHEHPSFLLIQET